MAALRIIFDAPQLNKLIESITAQLLASSYEDLPVECLVDSVYYKTLLKNIGREIVKIYNSGNSNILDPYLPIIARIANVLRNNGFSGYYVYEIDIRKNCIVELVIEV